LQVALGELVFVRLFKKTARGASRIGRASFAATYPRAESVITERGVAESRRIRPPPRAILFHAPVEERAPLTARS